MTHPLHFFITGQIDKFQVGCVLELSPSDSHHLSKVLRVRTGAEISIASSELGQTVKAKIIDVSQSPIQAEVVATITNVSHETVVKTLLVGLCKPKACEEIIEKASELGVQEIIFFRAERSQYNDRQFEQLQNKISRWQTIAETACKQTKRSRVASVQILSNLTQALEGLASSSTTGYILSLRPNAQSIFKLQDIESGIVLALGPEGDLTAREYDILENAFLLPVSIGDTIYRTESAAVFGVVALKSIRAFTIASSKNS